MHDIAISVIVCTCNRADKLTNALQAFQQMRVPAHLSWELVVVDNGSTDATKEIVSGFAAELPIRYTYEPRPGLANARNRGIEESKGKIVAYTDDDCLVAADWAVRIADEFASQPALDVIGGRVELFNKADRPVSVRLFRDRFAVTGPGQVFSSIPGCNIAIARRVFEHVGRFDPLFGAGGAMLSAEDSDFLFRCLRAGRRLLYAPDVVVHHDHGRRSDEDVSRLLRSYRIGRGAFYCKHILRGDVVAAKLAYWEVRGLAARLLGSVPWRAGGSEMSTLAQLILGSIRYSWTSVTQYTRHCTSHSPSGPTAHEK